MSRFKYGKKSCCTSANVPKVKKISPLVVEEVVCLRDSIDTINGLLEEISELSTAVREELGNLENSIMILEDMT